MMYVYIEFKCNWYYKKIIITNAFFFFQKSYCALPYMERLDEIKVLMDFYSNAYIWYHYKHITRIVIKLERNSFINMEIVEIV